MDEIAEKLSECGSYVLEEWGMMMVDLSPGIESDFQWEERFYCATAQFHGAASKGALDGELTVICQRRFLDGLVKSVTGAVGDNDIDEQEELDALGELANVVCGNLLVNAFGSTATFDLPHIEVAVMNGGEVKHHQERSYVCFCCRGDDEPVAFLLCKRSGERG